MKRPLNMSENNSANDERLFYKLNMAQRILFKYADREMNHRMGVPVTQTAVLFFLLKHDGCLFKDISNVLFQNKSATTTLVERMERNGLIVKKKSETDGRATHIFLSDKGRDISKMALPLVTEFNRDLQERFSGDEMEVIHRFLDTIIEGYQ